MDEVALLEEIGNLQEWQDLATKKMDRLIGRILELEDQLVDANRILKGTTQRAERRMDLVALLVELTEQQRKRIYELEDQLVDAKSELRLKDVQNPQM